MAIVNMKKLSVIALSDDEAEVIETLMDMGVTQVEDVYKRQIPTFQNPSGTTMSVEKRKALLDRKSVV